jgi:hypothetical protein
MSTLIFLCGIEHLDKFGTAVGGFARAGSFKGRFQSVIPHVLNNTTIGFALDFAHFEHFIAKQRFKQT